MLNELQRILKENDLLILTEIKNIDNSCYDSDLLVIAFDKVKTKFCKAFGISPEISSTDIVLLLHEKDELVLIDMKKSFGLTVQKFYEKYIQTGVVRNKNIHSLFTLFSVASTYHIKEDFYPYVFHKLQSKQLKIKTLIFTDYNDTDMLFFEFSMLGKGTNFHDIMMGKVEVINKTYFEARYGKN